MIYYDYSSGSFVVDRSSSSTLPEVPLSNQATTFAIPSGPINWRIFIDASVIEVFVNEELAFATRSFPSSGSNLIDLYAQGGTANATSVTIYNITGGGTTSANRTSYNSKKNFLNVYPTLLIQLLQSNLMK